jgi:hypothetical protein
MPTAPPRSPARAREALVVIELLVTAGLASGSLSASLLGCGNGPQPRLPPPSYSSPSPSSAQATPSSSRQGPSAGAPAGPVTRAICYPGNGDCDGDLTNGCEQDLTRSPAHCGRCGNACVGGCLAGFCSDDELPHGELP